MRNSSHQLPVAAKGKRNGLRSKRYVRYSKFPIVLPFQKKLYLVRYIRPYKIKDPENNILITFQWNAVALWAWGNIKYIFF